jgi:cytochrome c6
MRARQRGAAQATGSGAATLASLAKDENAARRAFPEAALVAAAALCLALLCATPPAAASDVLRGSELYRSHCAQCHGPAGKPVLPGAPDFQQPTALLKADTALLAVIREGRGAMPGYAGLLRDREILDLVSHLRTLR